MLKLAAKITHLKFIFTEFLKKELCSQNNQSVAKNKKSFKFAL